MTPKPPKPGPDHQPGTSPRGAQEAPRTPHPQYGDLGEVAEASAMGAAGSSLSQNICDQKAQESALPRAGNARVVAARREKQARAEARAAAARSCVERIVSDEIADLPHPMRESAIVRRALTNRARAQLLLDAFYDRVDRGEAVSERQIEAAIKLFSSIQSATGDVLSRWPKADDRPQERRIPRSVVDWLDNIEYYSGSVRVIDCRDSRPPAQAPKGQTA